MSFVRYRLNHRSLRALSSVNSRVKANRLTGLLPLALMAFALATLLTGSVPALAQSAVDYDVDDDGLYLKYPIWTTLNAIRWDSGASQGGSPTASPTPATTLPMPTPSPTPSMAWAAPTPAARATS